MGKLRGCHDLNTTDWEFVLKTTAISYVDYSIQTGVCCMKRNAFIEIVNTTKVVGLKMFESVHC